MYGIIIENMCERIKSNYGEEVWLKIRDRARICEYMFVTHRVYSEKIVPRLARVASEVIGCTEEEFMDMVGHSFVEFVSRYEYGPLLRCLGRNLGDFVNGLDNLHEYMRFSYPKLKPPSFFCTEETSSGLTLHYRTRRQGYMYYVVGQLKEVGRRFYDVDVDVKVLKKCTNNNTFNVIFRLTFDNKEFCEPLDHAFEKGIRASVRSSLLLDLFPFHIVFNSKMIIDCTGNVLNSVLPNLVDEPLDHHFTLIRPIANLTWDAISTHTNNVFELCSKALVGKPLPVRYNGVDHSHDRILPENTNCHENETRRYPIRLKGQMMLISEWNSFIFLCTPIMMAISDLDRLGLYINDLSMHDSSRDLLLAGSQQSAELKLALDQEQIKSAELENSMRKLDMEIKKTDSLLYQMIPRTVADKLRRGEPATSTCEIFHEVTILFSDVVGFTRICSKITPMAVVAMLNDMYTTFDHLSECNNVYKVETIGDAYMVVSGAPNPTRYHALLVAEMALAMQSSMHKLHDPSDGGNMKIRIGLHTGTVVAGVVGMKMPRYCLFGDAVNTASRMESTGESCKIHVSEVTHKFLEGWPYVCEKRGVTHIKGKGSMVTYWLKGRTTRHPPKEVAELCPSYCLLPVSEHRNRSNSSGASSDVSRPNSRYEHRRESDSSVHLGIMGYQPVKGISDVESGWTWRPPNAEADQNSSLTVPEPEHHRSENSLPTSLSCPQIDTSMTCLSIQDGEQACLVNSVVDTKT
ncbi:soluble guanylate cyclase 88E-like isoform X2 [Anneissia japonica]|uniref:soluble guanylate cyclase 88E-like isoform X2 n=1 Tax=Anneissia japonica TaxID=1529436 RepID=UPI001425B78F|nr:soluble guanylate cyclase 88E-like isoform X2 [Anneissia japonica]